MIKEKVKRVRSISAGEVLRLESKGIHTAVFTKLRQELLCSRHLKAVSRELDPTVFVRIHKSHVVNIREVTLYENGNGGSVRMSDGSILPVAKRKKTVFLRHFTRKAN
jgi:two-component system LytT family response regulator